MQRSSIMTTRKLASFTSNLTYDRLSAHSREMAKRCMLDWLGVAIRGSQEKPAALIRQVLNDPGPGEATVFSGGTMKDNVLNAAFCNGSASHSLDFDDLHNPSIIHLACVVVPGVFSIAEKEHKSGKEMIAAVCAGYEAAPASANRSFPNRTSSGIRRVRPAPSGLPPPLPTCSTSIPKRPCSATARPAPRPQACGNS